MAYSRNGGIVSVFHGRIWGLFWRWDGHPDARLPVVFATRRHPRLEQRKNASRQRGQRHGHYHLYFGANHSVAAGSAHVNRRYIGWLRRGAFRTEDESGASADFGGDCRLCRVNYLLLEVPVG